MSYGQTASEVHLMYHTVISTLQIGNRLWKADVSLLRSLQTHHSQKLSKWLTFSQMSCSLCCAWKWRQNTDDPWQTFASPTHTLGWVQGEEDNPEAICRMEKFLFRAKLPLICVTWPHFRPWLLLMAQTFLFFKRWRFSFLPHFLPMKCKDQSNLQVSRQRDPGCSLYRLLCNYWCYFDLVMLVNGQRLFWAQEASGPLAVPLHYTNTCSLNISLAVTLQRKPRVKHHQALRK